MLNGVAYRGSTWKCIGGKQMLVMDWMSAPVITVDVHDSMQHAVNLMTENKIGTLPVMQNNKLVGIVTDRDLKEAAPSSVAVFDIKQILRHLSQVKMENIMTREPITVPPDFTIEEAAEKLQDNNISGCPVLDRAGDLAGIITKNDIFRAMTSITGMSKRGLQLGFMLEDRPGAIKEVTDVIRKYDARLISIVTTYHKAPHGYRYVHIRTFGMNREILPEMKAELKKRAKMLYLVDLRHGERESYAGY
jgi:acetoin utilization protein AcuB